jgi:hypothetical protein
MSSSTRWTSRALVAAGAGGLLAIGAVFGAGDVSAASADDTPPPERPTRDASERPGTLSPTTASPERPTRDARGRPGTLPAAAPVSGVPDYTG